MSEEKHARDENGICWTTQTVKGEIAWILCRRASYEAIVRCDEHSPLEVQAFFGMPVVIDPAMPEDVIELRTAAEIRRVKITQ